MEPAEDGQWVKHEDVAKLKADNCAVLTELAALVNSLPDFPEAEFRKKLAALTSEDDEEHEKVAEED